MVTKEIQRESNHDFSDAVVASRELQQKGVNIDEEDISIEKKILVRDRRSRINLSSGEHEKIRNPDITKQDIKKSLDSNRSPKPLRMSSISGFIEFQDLKSEQRSRTRGVLVEQEGNEYVYPVRVIYTVHIDPSDPIIDQEYYIKADSKSESEEIKNDIIESKESYLESNDTDVVLTNVNEVSKYDDHMFNYAFCFLMSFFWALSSGFSLLADSVSALFVIEAFCAFTWFIVGVHNYYDSKEETTEFRTTNVNRYVSGVNVDQVVEEYVNSKTKKENIDFEIEENGVVRCVSEESGVTWTLSENGIVPEVIVSALEKKGFSSLDSPKYNATIMPVEIAEEKDEDMISDCRNWYLDIGSAEPVTDNKSKYEAA